MELNLEALGLTKEELADRLIEKMANEFLTEVQFGEDGDEWRGKSPLARKFDALIKKRVDDAVGALAEKHILPNVSAFVESVTLTQTNAWGEKTGQTLTFIEYLTQRAEAYLREEVNYEGKTKAQDPYGSWRKAGTRVEYLVDQHLQYSIKAAMENGLKNINAAISDGLANAVKIKLAEIMQGLKGAVSVK